MASVMKTIGSVVPGIGCKKKRSATRGSAPRFGSSEEFLYDIAHVEPLSTIAGVTLSVEVVSCVATTFAMYLKRGSSFSEDVIVHGSDRFAPCEARGALRARI